VEFFARSLLGFAIGPIVGGAVAFLGDSLLSSGWGWSFVAGGYIGLRYGTLAAFVLAWPLHLALLWLRLTHVLTYIFLGGFLSITVLAVVILPHSVLAELRFASIAVIAGSAAGFVFWLIRRPDRDWQPVTSVSEAKP
jgi:hypothetical protein